jgi:2-hydroxy fatty acid dioxygenase
MNELSRWERILVMYGSCHRHPVNVAIHLLFVPIITASIFMALMPIALPLGETQLSLAYVFAGVIFAYYLSLDVASALALVPIAGSLLLAARWAATSLPRSWLWIIAASGFFGGYIAQFIGHAIERRKPALVDHPIRGVLAAPLFMGVEVSRMLGLRRQLFDKVHEEIVRRDRATAAVS